MIFFTCINFFLRIFISKPSNLFISLLSVPRFHQFFMQEELSAVCWSRSRFIKCFSRVLLSGRRWELPRVVVWMQLIVLKRFEDTLFWDSSSSSATLLELLHGSRFTTAITASSLVDDRAVRGRPTFTCIIGVSRRRCSKCLCLNEVVLISVESYELCYYRHRRLRACCSWVHLTKRCVFSWQIKLLRNLLTPIDWQRRVSPASVLYNIFDLLCS